MSLLADIADCALVVVQKHLQDSALFFLQDRKNGVSGGTFIYILFFILILTQLYIIIPLNKIF